MKGINEMFHPALEIKESERKIVVLKANNVQEFLEIMICNYIKDMIGLYAPQTPVKLALAGGVFANVKLNQRIADLKEVSSLFVYPHSKRFDHLPIYYYYFLYRLYRWSSYFPAIYF